MFTKSKKKSMLFIFTILLMVSFSNTEPETKKTSFSTTKPEMAKTSFSTTGPETEKSSFSTTGPKMKKISFSPPRPKMKKHFKGCSGHLLDFNASSLSHEAETMQFQHDLKKVVIPRTFDSRTRWSFCQSIQRVYNQRKCGGCWAYAASSVMSDRFCIAARGKLYPHISTQDLLECCDSCIASEPGEAGGCGDGITARAFVYWRQVGIVTGNEACKPTDFETEDGVARAYCRKMCTNPYYVGRYETSKTYASTFYMHVDAFSGDLRQVQAEIMIYGPIAGAMDIYEYMFEIRKKTVLTYGDHLKDEERRVHAVKILGWDVIDGVPVWIIGNSWGRRWCDSGFCYVRRGQNDFNIESYVMATATARINQLVKMAALNEFNRTSGSETHLLKTFYVVFVKILIIDLH